MTAVVASGFQRPLFNFHANSIDSSVTESIALAFQQTILRKSRFQVGKQNVPDQTGTLSQVGTKKISKGGWTI